jgi:cytochrome c-type biogenesis protein
VDGAALGLALTAGALAALNPCGFALLPAYLSTFVLAPGGPTGEGPGPSRLRTVGRAVSTTAAMTVGFVVVFAVFGLVVAPAAAASQRYLPYVTAVTGVLLAAVGLGLLLGKRVGVWMPRIGFRGRGAVAALGYGVVYALASLTCTVAPFLAIVVTSLRSDDVAEGLLLFVTYAAGMGLVVGVAAVAVALASTSVLSRMRSSGGWVQRAVGVLVLVVGAYVAYYGIWEVRVLDGADPEDPVVDTALEIQRWVSDRVRSLLP